MLLLLLLLLVVVVGGGTDQCDVAACREHYFSEQNLESDWFLREQMDGQGWVSVDVIARFNSVSSLGVGRDGIIAAARRSPLLDVDAKRGLLRSRASWRRFASKPPGAVMPMHRPVAVALVTSPHPDC